MDSSFEAAKKVQLALLAVCGATLLLATGDRASERFRAASGELASLRRELAVRHPLVLDSSGVRTAILRHEQLRDSMPLKATRPHPIDTVRRVAVLLKSIDRRQTLAELRSAIVDSANYRMLELRPHRDPTELGVAPCIYFRDALQPCPDSTIAQDILIMRGPGLGDDVVLLVTQRPTRYSPGPSDLYYLSQTTMASSAVVDTFLVVRGLKRHYGSDATVLPNLVSVWKEIGGSTPEEVAELLIVREGESLQHTSVLGLSINERTATFAAPGLILGLAFYLLLHLTQLTTLASSDHSGRMKPVPWPLVFEGVEAFFLALVVLVAIPIASLWLLLQRAVTDLREPELVWLYGLCGFAALHCLFCGIQLYHLRKAMRRPAQSGSSYSPE